MFEQVFNNLDNLLRQEAGCTTELDYTEQTSWMLFLKYLDDLERAKGKCGLQRILIWRRRRRLKSGLRQSRRESISIRSGAVQLANSCVRRCPKTPTSHNKIPTILTGLLPIKQLET